MKQINRIYRSSGQHWVGDGFLVQQLFSHMGENRGTDPFLMLDYAAPSDFPPNSGNPRGVGQHPHKGFETITIAYQGEVAHADTSGGGGVLREGDVQWMTAGAGVVHEEFHSPEFSKKGGTFEMVQLWLNLPAKYKNEPPKYQHLARENIPIIQLDDAGSARLIAGNFKNQAGAAQTFSEVNVWDIDLAGEYEFPIPENHNLLLVILRGSVQINSSESASAGELITFTDGDSNVKISGNAKILLLSGVPINEPIAAYGPFVMNTKAEIMQAFADFQSGKFGFLN